MIASRGPGAASVALSVNAGPLRDERGRVEGAVAVLRDLTETQRAVTALRVANQRLAENNRLKGEFVANMSHELRTPLNAILGFAQLLRLGPEGRGLSPRQLDGVERIHRNGKNLLSLIDGILDVARIEAGVRTLHPEHFDVVEAVQSAFGELESLAAQRGVAYRMRVEGEFPVAFTDRGRLRQVVVNLLSNALKFTVEGGVELALSREGDRARVEVRDTGVGIRSEDLGLIFEKFRQVDGSTTRRAGGVGLGLNIVRELVELLGGEVSVRSAYGEGSTFTVLVPLLGPTSRDAEPEPAAEPDAPSASAEERAPAPTVLVIEDNPDSAALLRVTLERAGLRVRVADNGVAGLRLARALRPAAITLDIMMPRMDGWRVLQALRADEATAETPVIVCSIVDNRLLGYRLGASEYLTKPVDPAALLTALARVGAVPDAGDVLVVDDEHAMREMVREALRVVGIATREASSGEQALAMVAERAPRAVFIDLFMPGGMSGFEFLARMRSAPETAEVPVVVLTGKDVSPEERRRFGGQIADVVRKGEISLPGLAQRVRDLLPALGVAVSDGADPDR
ncbi:MAG: response regulator [Polyangiales bacterium]